MKTKRKEDEKDVSIEAVSRGFGENLKRLFAELCPRRMYLGRAKCKSRIMGLGCAEFCPFYDQSLDLEAMLRKWEFSDSIREIARRHDVGYSPRI